ncbi:hypothetical protein DUI87_09425 [Hirundo rustica rustica]|uniref:Uncharacterized protein n=1 Tax=Hirundo rustica rustica TaxID=333673 RepID=A0A3M0KNW0_HIRRU|nr:hypothetical protein DUI87_09425 [Hirundo rustica rustica]
MRVVKCLEVKVYEEQLRSLGQFNLEETEPIFQVTFSQQYFLAFPNDSVDDLCCCALDVGSKEELLKFCSLSIGSRVIRIRDSFYS